MTMVLMSCTHLAYVAVIDSWWANGRYELGFWKWNTSRLTSNTKWLLSNSVLPIYVRPTYWHFNISIRMGMCVSVHSHKQKHNNEYRQAVTFVYELLHIIIYFKINNSVIYFKKRMTTSIYIYIYIYIYMHAVFHTHIYIYISYDI